MSDTEPTSLRAYFAANAPADPPDWFQPDMDHLPLPKRPNASYDPVADRIPQELQTYNEQFARMKKQRDEHRYFAWRWHYADKMVEHGRKAAKPMQITDEALGQA